MFQVATTPKNRRAFELFLYDFGIPIVLHTTAKFEILDNEK